MMMLQAYSAIAKTKRFEVSLLQGLRLPVKPNNPLPNHGTGYVQDLNYHMKGLHTHTHTHTHTLTCTHTLTHTHTHTHIHTHVATP